MTMKKDYIEKMAAELKVWGAQISLLEAKAESLGASMKVMHHEVMSDLKNKQQSASEKLHAMETTSIDAWDDIKETSQHLWLELKKGIDDAHARFK